MGVWVAHYRAICHGDPASFHPVDEADAMPVVVRFITQSIDPKDKKTDEVLQALRDGLALESLVVDTDDVATNAQNQVGEMGTLDALRSSISYHHHIMVGWTKVIEKANSAGSEKRFIAIDLFVLLMIHGISGHKKSTELLVMRSIKKERLTAKVVNSVFKAHHRALKDFHEALVSLAEYLMRTADASCRSVAAALYTNIFRHFEIYCKQEVMGALVTHVGSGNFPEVSGALDNLETLVKKFPRDLHQFYIMLKQILDYVDNLALSHVRKLFHVLCTLGVNAEDATGQESDELHIYIRKMMSKTTLHDMRVGIVGAVMLLRAYAKPATDGGGEQSVESVTESKALLQIVKKHFGCTEATIGGLSTDKISAAGLFYDELAALTVSGKLHADLLTFIEDEMLVFTDLYLIERTAEPQSCGDIKPVMEFDLDNAGETEDDAEGEVLVNMLPGILAKHGRPENLLLMCPQFNLLQAVEKANAEGSLSEIDALAGCGLWFVPELAVSDFEGYTGPQQRGIIHCYFFAINFFRDLVNAFACQEDEEMKLKTLHRLEHAVKLEATLVRLLKRCPSFVPLPAQFEVDTVQKQKAKPKGRPSKRKKADGEDENEDEEFEKETKKPKKPRKKGGKKKRRKKKGADSDEEDDDDDDDENDENDDDDREEADPKKEVLVLDYTKYFPFFRELDLDVLGTLIGLALQESKVDTEMQTIATETDRIYQADPKQLYYLLRVRQR